jgi:uncharacterized membrane protein YbaN (DUF454 family)
MEFDPTDVIHPSQATDRESCEGDLSSLDIELDGKAGLIQVSDARLFRPARRAYARRLLEALCNQPGVRKAEIDLASSTCRVDFDLLSNSPAVMAEVFADAVRTVPVRAGRTPWWRRSSRWSTLTAYRFFGGISLWETHADQPESIRLFHEGSVGDRATYARLADSMAGLEGVERCQISLWSHQITVVCGPSGSPVASRTVDRLERILEGRKFADPIEAGYTFGAVPYATDGQETIATGWKRLTYVALAGGAFTMTLVGLVVPGVPTVPFLLATNYYLARSSPSMNERLRRTAFFGPILREWEGHAALSLTSKGKLLALTATIVVVAVVLAPLTPFTLGVILVISSLSVYGVTRMPALTRHEHDSTELPVGATLAFPAR